MAKKKTEEVKIIKQRETNEHTVAKNYGDLKKGAVIKLHPITAESFKKRGIID